MTHRIVLDETGKYFFKNGKLKKNFQKNIFLTREQTPKPKGLWYGIEGSWYNWSYEEKMIGWINGTGVFLLEIPKKKKILKIETVQKIKSFNDKYAASKKNTYSINWAKVKKDYDGIEFNPYPLLKEYREHYLWYWDIDAESGCIWNLDGIKGKFLGKLPEIKNSEKSFKKNKAAFDKIIEKL